MKKLLKRLFKLILRWRIRRRMRQVIKKMDRENLWKPPLKRSVEVEDAPYGIPPWLDTANNGGEYVETD